MASYIASNSNRFYVAAESVYGVPPAITAAERFPAVRLKAHQAVQMSRRLDKTGTRTYLGTPGTARRSTAFEVITYLTSWLGRDLPAYNSLIQGAMGSAPTTSTGLSVTAVPDSSTLQMSTNHNLSIGSCVSLRGEIRFVTGIPDGLTVTLNAPFTTPPQVGDTPANTVSYSLATSLPSLSLFDYWDPDGAVSRIVSGAGVDTFDVRVNGDYHEMVFGGPAADLIDSAGTLAGPSGLTTFPDEPALADFDFSIVPGQLGQIWIGTPSSQLFTLTQADIEIKNNLVARNQEFGSSYPRAIVPGLREVNSKFTLFAQDTQDIRDLYSAAKTRGSISVMLQLGEQQGQIMGVYLPKVIPELPLYDDSETSLLWQFKNNRAQGVANDEAYIGFA